MTPTYHLYVDDSGSKDLDKNLGQEGSKWFALGGVIIAEEDEEVARQSHAAFCARWDISVPLHSYDIRNRVNEFAWLNNLDETDREQFFSELSSLLLGLPVIGTACVVHRKGYNDRYREKYGQRRWALCKTAFSIVAERAAKFAHGKDRRLKVFYERSDKPSERRIEGYYASMRSDGMPFDASNSAKYLPLTHDQLRYTLWDIKKKKKSSPVMQIADLYLFPMCVGGYDATYRPYCALRAENRLIDCMVSEGELPHLGIKYSCFDGVERKF